MAVNDTNSTIVRDFNNQKDGDIHMLTTEEMKLRTG